MTSGITVYDSLYVAQALKLGAPILTLDGKQRSVALEYGLRVVP